MRRLVLVCFALAPALGIAQAPAPGDLVINEVMYDPPAPQPSANEWVELLNVTGGPLDLGGLTLTDGNGTTEPVAEGTTLPAGGHFVIARDGDAFAAAYPGVAFVDLGGFPSLNNTGDRVALLVDGTEIDAVPYLPSWGGSDASLERRDPLGPSDAAGNFGTTTSPAGGTPGARNTLFVEDTEPPELVGAEALDAQTVRATFSEAVDPVTAETASNYAIDGDVGTPAAALVGDAPNEVVLALAAPLAGPATYTLTVRGVTDLRGNALAEATATFFAGQGGVAGPGDVVINEFLYDEPADGTPGEYVELLNPTDRAFDLRDFGLNDGTGSPAPITDQPVFVGPGEYAVVVEDGALFAAAFPGVPFVEPPTWSALNNTGDAVVLTFGDVTVDSLFYGPDWGGQDASLERRDPDGPSVRANFGTTTDPRGGTPGAPNVPEPADAVPPALVAVEAVDATTVRVAFDEALDPATAEAPSNYTLDGGVGAPASATLQDDPSAVALTVSNVADAAGNVLADTTATFFFGVGSVPAPRDLVVNEFLYDEPAADNPGEFVELVNRTDRSFDLREFTLNDGTGDAEPVTGQPVFVGPGEYAVIVEDGALFAAVFPGVPFVEQPRWSALNNGGDAVVLAYQGTVIDSLFYDSAWGGEDASLERKDPDGPSSVASNYATTSDLRGGTPGAQNSQFMPDVTGPQLVAAAARPDGRALTVTLDEPLDPTSFGPSAFSVGGQAPAGGDYDGATTVALTLNAPLPAGPTTVTATDLVDLLGNTTASTSTTVDFTPDVDAPAVTRATALGGARVRVRFSEPLRPASAQNPEAYTVEQDGEAIAVGGSVAVVDEEAGGVLAAEVEVTTTLPDRTLLTLVARGIEDLAGNATARSEARFFVGTADTPGPGDVVVTEVQYDPQNGSDGEYLELLNTTASAVFDLRGILLSDGEDEGAPLSDEPAVLLPGEPVAVARDADGFRAVFPSAPFVEGEGISLSNSGEAVVLRAAGAVLDSVAYAPGWHRVELDDATGISLERRDPAGPSTDPANWSSSLDERGGTPSAPNSVGLSGTPVERAAGLTITSPFAPTRGEAAQITYRLSTEAALVRARIYDGGGRLVREIEAGRLSGSTATLTWDGTDESRRPLRAGIYVVLVEAVDAQGGTTEALRGVVVLARP